MDFRGDNWGNLLDINGFDSVIDEQNTEYENAMGMEDIEPKNLFSSFPKKYRNQKCKKDMVDTPMVLNHRVTQSTENKLVVGHQFCALQKNVNLG